MPIIDSLKFVNVIIDEANILSATPEDVLSGRYFVGLAKKFDVGTIPVMDIRTDTSLLCGESITIPYGHNPSEFVVSAVSLADQTPGNVGAADVLVSKICWSNGVKITGTMPNIGTINVQLNCSDVYTVEKGYHTGAGKITVSSLATQTPGNATTADARFGKRFWVAGVEIIGSMPENPASDITINAGESYTISLGYHTGAGRVLAASLASQTQATAAASDIVTGKTAWVNGVLITGTIPKINTPRTILPLNGTYTIPQGLHPGTEVVTQEIATQAAFTITPSFEAQTITVANKYMTGNITVTGLNALNYQNFNASSPALGTSSFTVVVSEAKLNTYETVLLTLPVDNWHDQSTNNIYHITATDGPGNVLASGIVMANNLNAASETVNQLPIRLLIGSFGSYTKQNLNIYVVLDPDTNAHVFKFGGTIDTTGIANVPTNSVTYNVSIKEVMGLRQFGDAHDV